MATDHVTYYNSKGEVVPSTTTVIKLLNKNLDGWANWMGLRGIRLKQYLDEKADVGTYVHSICELYFSGKLDNTVHADTRYLTPQDFTLLKIRLRHVDELLRSMGFRPYAQELELHGEKYGGTLDLVFYNDDTGEYILIDLKTAKDVYNTMYIQLMAYCNLILEKRGIHISKVGILLITRDPEDPKFCELYDVGCNMCEHYAGIFSNLLNIYYLLSDQERKRLLN